jgi:hypothetical protein
MNPASIPLITVRRGRVCIALQAVRAGQNYNVTLTGGDAPHIGAVSVSQMVPGARHPEKTTVSTSVITLPGHRETRLATLVSERLARELRTTVSVSCGVHLENIHKEEIAMVFTLSREAVRQLLRRIRLREAE